jgi:hypothetical protein
LTNTAYLVLGYLVAALLLGGFLALSLAQLRRS